MVGVMKVVPIHQRDETNLERTQRLHAEAQAAAQDLVTDWLEATQGLATLASALGACPAVPAGVRALAARQASNLHGDAVSAQAIMQR